jgi:uncharacterized membrane protein
MGKNRLEAFSDGMIAIFITIMVLEMKTPHAATFAALKPYIPVFLSYVLSFIYLQKVNGGILWANLYLMFWLSLIPFTTSWVGEYPHASAPAVCYGIVLLMAGLAYLFMQHVIKCAHGGKTSLLARAVGVDLKGKFSAALYATAIILAFRHPWIAQAIYALVALMWLVPDKRIEKILKERN